MAAVHITITVDLSVVVPIFRRLAAMPRSDALVRHLEALVRDQRLIELQSPAPGAGCTCRAVPSVQLLRVLESYGVE